MICHMDTIAPIRQALVGRFLLEFHLLLIVSKLFSFNGLFIILSSVILWIRLFAIMVLFNLIYSWS